MFLSVNYDRIVIFPAVIQITNSQYLLFDYIHLPFKIKYESIIKSNEYAISWIAGAVTGNGRILFDQRSFCLFSNSIDPQGSGSISDTYLLFSLFLR